MIKIVKKYNFMRRKKLIRYKKKKGRGRKKKELFTYCKLLLQTVYKRALEFNGVLFY